MRTMRRSRQELPKEEALRLLDQGSAGVLAVLDEDGDTPYAVPLSYVYFRGNIYFHCAREGRKIDAIARNDRVSFCVIAQDQWLPEKFTTLFRSVIVFGRARVLTDPAEMRDVLEALADKYAPGVPGREEEIASSLHRVAVIELVPVHITGKEAIELTRAREASAIMEWEKKTVPGFQKQPLKEQEWADRMPDPDEETNDAEPTYRDGSVQHECWAEDGYTRDE